MIITRSPMRITLGGGGTDLPSYYERYGGFFISAAINKYVFININRPAIDRKIRLKFSSSEIVDAVKEIDHPLFREALSLTGINRNIEIASMADIASGTGLGSSGSFLTALLLGLHTFKKEQVFTQILAEEACNVEIDLAKKPVGKQDQYVAAFGGLNCFTIARNGKVTVTPLNVSSNTIDDLERGIQIFFTGLSRDSHEILEQQNADTACDSDAVIKSLHETKEIGLEVRKALENGDVDCFGRLLDYHWQIKKKRSTKISSERIDHLYALAMENGALGGKLMGPGGCGFFMFYCPSESKSKVRSAMSKEGLRELRFRFDTEGAKVIVNMLDGKLN